MKKTITLASKTILLIVLAKLFFPYTLTAQEKVQIKVGADFVSNYIWRGMDCGGVSIQPTITVSKSGFSLTAFGSTGFDRSDTRELDLTIGYTSGKVYIGVTDYWFSQQMILNDGNETIVPSGYFTYAAHSTAHVMEATLRYDPGLFALQWNTNFAGSDYYNTDGSRSYSTYIEAAVPFKAGGIDFTAELGLTPWEGAYSDRFNVTNIAIRALKEIKLTDDFALPVFAKIITNPYTEGAYFVCGISL